LKPIAAPVVSAARRISSSLLFIDISHSKKSFNSVSNEFYGILR
jgi:hypothetical protein